MPRTRYRQPIITVLGHIDCGKCVSPETIIPLANGKLVTAEELYASYECRGEVKKVNDGFIVEVRTGPEMFSFDGQKIITRHATHLWKLRAPEKLVRVKLASGDEITTTLEHPFFVLTSSLEIMEKKAEDVEKNELILVPKILNFDSSLSEIKEEMLNRMEQTKNFVVFLDKEKSEAFLEKLSQTNLQELKRIKLFSTDPYTCVAHRRFRLRDFILISKHLGFDEVEIYNMIASIKNSSEKWRAGHTSNEMRLPKSEDDFKKMGYVLGCLAGDGYIPRGTLNNNDEDIQTIYQQYVNEVFGLSSKVKQGRTCQIVETNGGRTFKRFLTEFIGFPEVNKSSEIEFPQILRSYKLAFIGFVEGWFDTDGYASRSRNSIEITSKSKKIVKQVATLLLGFGIHSVIAYRRGYYTLRIANKPYIENFLLNFSLRSRRKNEVIVEVAQKSLTSRVFDMLPMPGSALNSFQVKNIYQKIPHFNIYQRYSRLSRPFLQKLMNALENCEEVNVKKLRLLIESDISCVKVISKEIIKAPCEYVYDFTMPETHNFVAERVIVHNTSLLDKIRGTAVQAREAGGITQHIGASYMPRETVEAICGPLLKRFNFEMIVPGLLVIDTPGHEVFSNLRLRGGSASDISILVVDVMKGFQVQTHESLDILISRKVPFLVAANKVDLIHGWRPKKTLSIMESLEKQSPEVRERLNEKIYDVIAALSTYQFRSEYFEKVKDFRETVSIVPVSAVTGEGLQELLTILVGLTQKFLLKRLEVDYTRPAKGSILEVTEVPGLGTVLKVIHVGGVLRTDQKIVLATPDGPITTRIKAMLMPAPLDELRAPHRRFRSVEETLPASGVIIAAADVEEAYAGSPFYSFPVGTDPSPYVEEIRKEVETIRIMEDKVGVVVKADTLGSLEAFVEHLKRKGIPIRRADVGSVSKRDVVEASVVKKTDDLRGVVLAFNVATLSEAEEEASKEDIPIFEGEILYRITEEYLEWVSRVFIREKQRRLEALVFPGKIKVLTGYVFRKSKPAIMGVEVLKGRIKPKHTLIRDDGKKVGDIHQIQERGETLKEATRGMQVAISIRDAVVGRDIFEGDVLHVNIPEQHARQLLGEFYPDLSGDERDALDELVEIKRKSNPLWAY
ncbi:MAG: translation initiation factor IF-2 [Candidatus Geothermarchaeales archaeon]